MRIPARGVLAAPGGATLFLVIQTGSIAAVAVGFARYLGVLWPAVSERTYLIPPIHLTGSYAVSLSSMEVIVPLADASIPSLHDHTIHLYLEPLDHRVPGYCWVFPAVNAGPPWTKSQCSCNPVMA